MARIYKAILRDDRVEWIDALPDNDPASQGPAMADTLALLADASGISSIPDPVAWQRESRQPPSLPKRGAWT